MATGKPHYNAVIDLPFGRFAICANDDGLLQVVPVSRANRLKKADHPVAADVCQQLHSYSANSKFHFSVTVKASGTPFQKKVWRALSKIPANQTVTYGEMAHRLRTSARAVGNACRRNPAPIVVPCHRVVAKNGTGGFMGKREGSAIQMKNWLLRHEASSA